MTVAPLSERARELLEHYREAESLDAADRARLLAAVERSLAGGSIGDARQGGGSGAAAQGTAAKAIAIAGAKVLVGALLVLVPAGWVLHSRFVSSATAVRAPGASVHAPVASVSTGDLAVVAPIVAAPIDAPAPSPLPLAMAQDPRPRAAARGEHGGSVKPTVARTPRVAPSFGLETTSATPAPASAMAHPIAEGSAAPQGEAAPAPAVAAGTSSTVAATVAGSQSSASASVDEEVRLLALAYAQLRAGQPSLALTTLAEQERRFPDGKLIEPRQVARILALCTAGQREAARSEAARFLALHPGSPFSNRVRATCSE